MRFYALLLVCTLIGCPSPAPAPVDAAGADTATPGPDGGEQLDVVSALEAGAPDARPDASVPDAAPSPDAAPQPDVAPEPDACVPSAEVCDGVDNDCNGVTDDNNAFLSCARGSCVNGACGCPAESPLACPDHSCVDGQTNTFNCGACGVHCSGDCIAGVCEGCPADHPAQCGSTVPAACRDLSSDPQNCGGCFARCPDNTPRCVAGACVQ
jgi:hypothetical protein